MIIRNRFGISIAASPDQLIDRKHNEKAREIASISDIVVGIPFKALVEAEEVVECLFV